MTELVTASRIGHISILTLTRPDALNALSAELMEQLASALKATDDDTVVRAVVLTGAGRAFCAGADVTELHKLSVQETLASDGFPRRLFDTLSAHRKPLIAAVNGLALGGGCEIALACDIVIAGASARFGLPEVTLGLIPGAGGTQRLVHAIGKAKAMGLLLTGEPMTAADAEKAGLLTQVVANADCLVTATRIAERIARNSPLAVQLAKDAARAAQDPIQPHGLSRERRNFFLLIGTHDMREGVQAFMEKRAPTFTGT